MIFFLSTALAQPLDAHLLYFVLVDRFFDQKENVENDPNIQAFDDVKFHGGDFLGIVEKMNHLEAMGVDALWLSPIFNMRHEDFHGHGAYHGYWLHDMETIEPYFGGEEDLKILASEMETRQWNLILDMVYNHVSFDSPWVTQKPTWFHEAKSIENWNDPYERTHYQVHGLPDLAQEKPEVYEYLYTKSLYWQEYANVKGFRLDALRHMENDFLRRLSIDLHSEVEDFWLLGEDFTGSPSEIDHRARLSGLDALFDFPMYYAMTDVFCHQKSIYSIGTTLSSSRSYPTNLQMVTFLDNHDLPRIASICTPKMRDQALFFQFLLRGLPMIAYGTEFGLLGDKEPQNRKPINWEEESILAPLIRDLTQLRKDHPVLATGKIEIIDITSQFLFFAQKTESETAYIAINMDDEEKQINIPNPAVGFQTINQQLVPMSQKNETDSTLLWMLPSREVGVWFSSSKMESKVNLIDVRFEIEAPMDKPLYVIGSAMEIGGWDPNQALALKKEGNIWTAKITIPSDAVISWKTLTKLGDEIIWENGENRILFQEEMVSISLMDN